MIPKPLYRYAYTAWIGRIGAPPSAVYIGEVESPHRTDALNKIRAHHRRTDGRYPRQLKLSAGHFSRLKT